jgi:hypothetical protein
VVHSHKTACSTVFSTFIRDGPRELILSGYFTRFFYVYKVLFVALPIVFPAFLCYAIIRLSQESRASRARIKLLEDGLSSESEQQRLITYLRKLGEIDNTVTETVDTLRSKDEIRTEQHDSMASYTEIITTEPTEPESNSKDHNGISNSKSTTKSGSGSSSKNMPTLKPFQKRMVRSLNSNLGHMKKYNAFIHPMRNSHAAIIARDISRFDFHGEERGVLQHWADGFVF